VRAEQSMPIGREHGVMLIEAMVAILIFSLGILGLVALGGQAVGAQSDAQYRTEASGLADAIAGEIAVNVDRTNNGANIAASLPAFSHRGGGANCAFAGADAVNPRVLALVARAGALPGATAAQQQIMVQNGAGAFNRVEITLCWRTANDNGAWRRHTYVTYVTGGAN
jgi:type IV pilus assembly protein PilV